jgi:hypothetical protein
LRFPEAVLQSSPKLIVVQQTIKLDLDNVAQMTAVTATRCEQHSRFFQARRIDAPFFRARHDHGRMIGGEFLVWSELHSYFFPQFQLQNLRISTTVPFGAESRLLFGAQGEKRGIPLDS